MISKEFKSVAPVLADLRAEEYEDDRRHAVRTAPRPPTLQADRRVTCDAPADAAAGGQSGSCHGAILWLSPPERRFLYDLLSAKIPMLQHEIHHTEARALRTVLRAELEIAIALAERIGPDPAAEQMPLDRAACAADCPVE